MAEQESIHVFDFTITVNGQMRNCCVGYPEPTHHPLFWQDKHSQLPGSIMESLQKLYDLASKNAVDPVELVKYAMQNSNPDQTIALESQGQETLIEKSGENTETADLQLESKSEKQNTGNQKKKISQLTQEQKRKIAKIRERKRLESLQNHDGEKQLPKKTTNNENRNI
ncbi:DUF2610 domain-containing protein [Candidatus Deianiraea vastatrix]|uniref:Uncharacterized protein n=1 Tax=Candidatus Deianiraea vastatrix TaxID=2163644 RepID=A0A5B8XDH4_9RICK|nr:DUF2610 domain-containing protein [Candidatus Deianiraea vastatrix]QED23066.1 hypothetical protein Deia_00259 [Candidatus Deianiraea vastatrix]